MFGEDTRGMVEAYKAVFLKFPYDLRLEHEVNFQTAFFSYTLATGFSAEAEERTNNGRIDIRISVSDDIFYIIELKLDGDSNDALSQIKRKKYYEKFVEKGRKIHLFGIVFPRKERNIVSWKEETIDS